MFETLILGYLRENKKLVHSYIHKIMMEIQDVVVLALSTEIKNKNNRSLRNEIQMNLSDLKLHRKI